jgi:hypothetical protein
MPPETVPAVDRFTGWPRAALQFFAGLRRDNSKTYFDARRIRSPSGPPCPAQGPPASTFRSWRPGPWLHAPEALTGSAKPGETPNR